MPQPVPASTTATRPTKSLTLSYLGAENRIRNWFLFLTGSWSECCYCVMEDVELIFSLCAPGSILFRGIPVCQFSPRRFGRQCCHCLTGTVQKPCPVIECRPLFVLCFGPGSLGYDSSSAEIDVPEWLDPRLAFLTNRGEDINEVCGPNNATVLQTAVSHLLLHEESFSRYIWRGTVLFDALVSFGARLNNQGPYGNILEQFWMEIHQSNVLHCAMESEESDIYVKLLLDECGKFIHRLIDEFRLDNRRAGPNGTIPTVEAMKRFGCNYYELAEDDINAAEDDISTAEDDSSTAESDSFSDAVNSSWFSYDQERKYYYDCNAETKGARIVP